MVYKDFTNCIRIIFFFFFGLMFSQVEKQGVREIKNDSIVKVGELYSKNDSINLPKTSQEQVKDVIDYKSEEQYFDPKNQKTYLITNATVLYLDMQIDADYIEVDMKTGDIYAVGKQDSLGKIIEPSIFKQGDKELEYGSFSYNINTKRGKAFNVRTEENMGSDRGVVVAGVVKQYNDTISGMRKIAYTTDEYYIEKKDSIADYHLEAEVGKLIKGKENTIITGPIVMKIYDITTPLALPFAFLPSGNKRSAGILMPSFGENESRGFYLEGLGFYLPIGEYIDLAFTSDFYTKGSIGLHAMSSYKVRYKYAGNFSFDWNKNINGIKGLPSYNKSTDYRIYWSHRQDIKANPNLTFSANVSLQSAKYYQNGINNIGILNGDYLTNNANSSISLTKNWPNSPFSASLYANVNQRVNPRISESASVDVQLPTLTLNMNRIYPFAPKNGPKKGLIKSIGFDYNFNLQNQINTNSDDFFTKKMFDDTQTGAKHAISVYTGTTIFNYFPVTFGANYNEVWTLNTIRKFYDAIENKEIEENLNGFASYRTFNTNAGINTTLYGTKIFGSADDDKMIKAVRHMISPSISFSYSPDFTTDFWDYNDFYIGENGLPVEYSKFNAGVYRFTPSGLSQSLSFDLANNIELKVRDRKSAEGVKKIKILESFNISTRYNFAAENFKLSPIAISGRTSILDGKLGVTFGATIDPYQYNITDENPNGIRVDELGNFRLSYYRLSTSYNFNQDFFGTREMNYDTRGQIRYEDFYFDRFNYAKFLTPWTLSLDLTHSVTNNYISSSPTTSIGLNGSISPTPHWAISGNTNFDLQDKEFAYTRLTFSRDLRSFVIDFSMVPFGRNQSWNFFIGIKANFLRETLKYEDRSFRSFNNF